MCLDAVLTIAGVTRIDFMSIDVAGEELDVLDGLDLQRWSPRLLLVTDRSSDLRLHRYLTARNYRWWRRTGDSNWYVPRATQQQLSVCGRWQFFKQFHLGTWLRRWRSR